MKKNYYLWDAIEGELIPIDSPKDAKDILVENYTEGNEAHPDIESCMVFEELEHPLKNQLQ